MEQRVTKCPHCQTAFRVTDDQLAVADGKVRCGSCLHVFSAADYWVSDQAPSPQPAATIESDSGATTGDIDDDELIFDDDEPLIDDTSERAGLVVDDDEGEDGEDQPAASDDMELSESFLHAGAETAAGADLFRELQEISEDLESDDEQWARQLLEDVDGEADEPAEDRPHEPHYDNEGGAEAVPDAAPSVVERWLAGVDTEPDSDNEQADDTLHAERDEKPRDSELEHMGGRRERLVEPTQPRQPAATLPRIEDEPLVLSTERALGPGMRQFLWGLAALAALAVAAGQYGWYHRDELAGDPSLRPMYVAVCHTVGCTLPPHDDIARIHSSNLVVRNDPAHVGALSVDAILTNTAPFEQPWPQLLLQFSRLHGDRPEAARVFTPAEYLGGEAAGLKLMPSQRPVHVSLTVVDPGPDAVSYQLRLLPPAHS